MSKEKSAVFIGHIQCTGVTRQIITPLIENMIAEGVRYFYSGGMGAFDRMTANAVFDLKKKYPDIKNYLVIPYQNFKVHDRNIFDEIILPNGEQHESNVYYISAIPKRNRNMVDHADYALCYVSGVPGGATDTYKYAQEKGLKLFNIYNLQS